ncbi:hypothetical protein B0H12DRAFT_1112678 [Mycena haematopus]|nr:hypothetical protein B0H12DRAFT_1112678 [Mycena haematopus]
MVMETAGDRAPLAFPLFFLVHYLSLTRTTFPLANQQTIESPAVRLRGFSRYYKVHCASAMALFEIQNPNIWDRLRYNILPSDMERPAIQHSIRFAQSCLAKEAPQDSATRYSAVALRQYISDYSSLLAPIRRLSVEILQLILVDPNIHDRRWIGSHRVVMYRTKAIGGVSNHWREVIRATRGPQRCGRHSTSRSVAGVVPTSSKCASV